MKTTAAAAITAPGILRAQNASGTVRIGWIGVGSRGYYLMERLYTGSKDLAQVIAVCDTYTGNLARAKDRVHTMGGNTPKTYADYPGTAPDPNPSTPSSSPRPSICTTPCSWPRSRPARISTSRNRWPTPSRRARKWCSGREAIRQGGAGRHAEPQQLALSAGQGNGRAGHDRRHPLRPRLLVSQFARRQSRLALQDPRRRQPAKHRLGQFPGTAPPSAIGIRIAISNGGFIGIIPAASPPICWCIRPISPTSSAAKPCRLPAWLPAESIAGPTNDDRDVPTPSAPSTSTPTSSTSTTVATSATTITATANSSWATKAPSRC